MEAEGIPEMLVPVYKLRRLVPKYFNCRQILQGDGAGKAFFNYRRTVGETEVPYIHILCSPRS